MVSSEANSLISKTDIWAAIGFGIVYILSPVWIGENVRPELRGFFLCLTHVLQLPP